MFFSTITLFDLVIRKVKYQSEKKELGFNQKASGRRLLPYLMEIKFGSIPVFT